MNIVVNRGLVIYGKKVALDLTRATFFPGTTGLIGLNGAGKSTLLSILASPKVGGKTKIEVDGEEIKKNSSGRYMSRVSFMPQNLKLPDNLTVREFITYIAWLRGLSAAQRSAAVQAVMDEVDLADRADDRLSSLSGGMYRRVGLAQALVGKPDLLLLDEPVAGLDPEQRLIFHQAIQTLPETMTTIISTHLIGDVLRLADYLMILHQGKSLFYGTINQFWDSSKENGYLGDDADRAFLAITKLSYR
ncbi:MAG: ATP-binding cassette domain-containing protein [Actinomycetota bacterium]